MKRMKWIGLGVTGALVLVAGLIIYGMATQSSGVSSASADRSATTSAPAAVADVGTTSVSTGPRCDNVSHTITFTGHYLPGRLGCIVDWTISDVSPEDCVMPVEPGKTPKPVCKGGEDAYNGVSITGWQNVQAGQPIMLDVTYHT